MVHIPKILDVSAKAVKSVALTGVGLAQAHPVAAAFTVVAIVGVGLAIYYVKHSKHKKKEDDLSYLSRGNKGHSENANSFLYDPETKSITTDIPKSTTSNEKKALRRRQVVQNTSSTNKSNPPCLGEDPKYNLTISEKSDIEISGNNLNTDDGKVLPNEILYTGKALTVEEKVNEFIRNISETEFIESTDQPPDVSRSIEALDQNSIDLSSDSNSQSYWIDNSFLDLHDFGSESSVGTLLPEQSDWCRACGEKSVNTHTQPCNHRYMCVDCATRIFRLFKRCKVCRSRIEEIIEDVS